MCPLPFWHIKYVLPIWRKIHKICLLTNGYILDSPGCTTLNIPSFLLELNLRAEKELMEHSRTEAAQAGATQRQVWPRSTCSEQGPGFGTLWAGTPASSLRIWSGDFRWVVVKFSIFAPAGTEERVCPSRPSAIERGGLSPTSWDSHKWGFRFWAAQETNSSFPPTPWTPYSLLVLFRRAPRPAHSTNFHLNLHVPQAGC